MIAFTICSNNYLAQASILAISFRRYNPSSLFFTIIVDELNDRIDYSKLPFEYLLIKEIEPDIDELVKKYDIIELNTCIKPSIFQHFFSHYDDEHVVYFDPDIKVFTSLENEFSVLFSNNNILLTPHIFTAIPLDSKQPGENNFLNYGIYNLGFIGIKKVAETLQFLEWWKERTYEQGYKKVEDGIFVDQLYINLVPLFYNNVFILQDMGYNMAPWNLHERTLTKKESGYVVNHTTSLKFFHFSSFIFNSNELPLHYYNRYKLKERQDLQEIYSGYNEDLKTSNYSFFNKVECVYTRQHKEFVLNESNNRQQDFWNASAKRKLFVSLIRVIPGKMINKVQELLSFYIKYN